MIEAKLRKIAPSPMVSMTTANWGWPEHAPQHGRVEHGAEQPHDRRWRARRPPSSRRRTRPRTCSGERAEHHEVALGEVDELGRLVDEHEAERDQAVDAADREAVQHELQDDVQDAPPLRGAPVIAGRRLRVNPPGRGPAGPMAALLVEPDVGQPTPVVDAVMRHEIADLRPVREGVERPAHGGPGAVLLQLDQDLPDQRQAFLGVELLRLLVDELADQLVAVAGVVADRVAAVVLVEDRVGIVDAEAADVGAQLVFLARGHRVPLHGVHLLQRRLHPHPLELADHEGGEVEIGRDRPRVDLQLERIRGGESRLGQQALGLGPLLVGLAVAGQALELGAAEPPGAARRRQHAGAHRGGALAHGLDERATVHRVAQGQPHADVIEGRARAVDQEVRRGVAGDLGADQLGQRRLQLLGHGPRGIAGERHVHSPRLDRGRLAAAIAHDEVAQAVEIRAALLEVVGVADVLDHLAAPPLLELERPGADAAVAHLGGRDVRGIDGRLAGGQHGQQRGLRPLEPEDDGGGIGRLDGLDVDVPVLARVEAQPGGLLGRLAHHVEGVLHVLRGERRAVVPLHVAPQEEDEVAIVVLPRPLLGQLADDAVERLARLERVEDHEVRVARRGRPHGGDGSGLVDREPGGQLLALQQVEDAAGLARGGRRGWRRRVRHAQHDGEQQTGGEDRPQGRSPGGGALTHFVVQDPGPMIGHVRLAPPPNGVQYSTEP